MLKGFNCSNLSHFCICDIEKGGEKIENVKFKVKNINNVNLMVVILLCVVRMRLIGIKSFNNLRHSLFLVKKN